VLTLSPKVRPEDLQRLINYATYLDATAGSEAKQEDVAALADEVSRKWWRENKEWFLK
jgi:hypothetical protein